MLSVPSPLSSAKATAASSTRSWLKGILAVGAGFVGRAMCVGSSLGLTSLRCKYSLTYNVSQPTTTGVIVSMPAPYPVQLDFDADRHITRWRPLVQWILAVPHLMIAWALRSLRQVLTLISFFTVLFTEQIPRPIFDAIVMTYRYEWRAMSFALFMHEDYPPFDFALVRRRRRGGAPHLAAPELSGESPALEAPLQVVPRHSPVLRGDRSVHCRMPRRDRRASSQCCSPVSTPRASATSSSTPTATRSGSRPTSAS